METSKKTCYHLGLKEELKAKGKGYIVGVVRWEQETCIEYVTQGKINEQIKIGDCHNI